jgi:hypothetical protein
MGATNSQKGQNNLTTPQVQETILKDLMCINNFTGNEKEMGKKILKCFEIIRFRKRIRDLHEKINRELENMFLTTNGKQNEIEKKLENLIISKFEFLFLDLKKTLAKFKLEYEGENIQMNFKNLFLAKAEVKEYYVSQLEKHHLDFFDKILKYIYDRENGNEITSALDENNNQLINSSILITQEKKENLANSIFMKKLRKGSNSELDIAKLPRIHSHADREKISREFDNLFDYYNRNKQHSVFFDYNLENGVYPNEIKKFVNKFFFLTLMNKSDYMKSVNYYVCMPKKDIKTIIKTINIDTIYQQEMMIDRNYNELLEIINQVERDEDRIEGSIEFYNDNFEFDEESNNKSNKLQFSKTGNTVLNQLSSSEIHENVARRNDKLYTIKEKDNDDIEVNSEYTRSIQMKTSNMKSIYKFNKNSSDIIKEKSSGESEDFEKENEKKVQMKGKNIFKLYNQKKKNEIPNSTEIQCNSKEYISPFPAIHDKKAENTISQNNENSEIKYLNFYNNLNSAASRGKNNQKFKHPNISKFLDFEDEYNIEIANEPKKLPPLKFNILRKNKNLSESESNKNHEMKKGNTLMQNINFLSGLKTKDNHSKQANISFQKNSNLKTDFPSSSSEQISYHKHNLHQHNKNINNNLKNNKDEEVVFVVNTLSSSDEGEQTKKLILGLTKKSSLKKKGSQDSDKSKGASVTLNLDNNKILQRHGHEKSEWYQGEYDKINFLYCGTGNLIKQYGEEKKYFYHGTFRMGKKHGIGVLYKINSDSTYEHYRGEWANNRQDGYGFLLLLDDKNKKKVFRKGKFENNNFLQGSQLIIDENFGPNGEIVIEKFEGEMQNNLYSGRGTLTRKVQKINKSDHNKIDVEYEYEYTGNFLDGLENGPGISKKFLRQLNYHYTYEGEFFNGKMHGSGRIEYGGDYYVDSYEGIFLEDQTFCVYGKVIFKSGDEYEGFFNPDHQKTLVGLYSHYDKQNKGEKFFGKFFNDKKDGLGRFVSPTESKVFVGTYNDGEKNGKFSLTSNIVEHSNKLHGLEKKFSIISTNNNKKTNNLFAQSFIKRIAGSVSNAPNQIPRHDLNRETITQSKIYFLFENDEMIEKSDMPIY